LKAIWHFDLSPCVRYSWSITWAPKPLTKFA